MVRKISILVMSILFIMTSSVFAMVPDTIDVHTARSWETLLVNSVDGTKYELLLLSDNAKYQEKYLSETNGLFVGDFYVYLVRLGGDVAFLQKNIHPFSTLDFDGLTPNGWKVITSKTGMPDILENITRSSGGGGYSANFYVIKDNRLQKIQFMNQNRKIYRNPISIDNREKESVRYLDDGTFYVHWWTNAWPDAGTYKTVYMFDIKDLIMIEAYTYKKAPRDENYHKVDVSSMRR